MLSLMLIIFVAIVGISVYFKFKVNDWATKQYLEIPMVLGSVLAVFVLVAMLFNFAEIINARDIKKQIIMYQEENQVIEQQMAIMVESYMKYEGETFDKFKVEDSMMLISLYPELKSDQLVVQQMKVHADNNTCIKELKAKLIDIDSFRWWLYFGGGE